MKSAFQHLGMQVPLLLAPMANVSGGLLARAISESGGLGIVGGGYCDRTWVHRELDLAGTTPVGVGFITWRLLQEPRLLDEVLERRPAAVFLSFGDIASLAPRVRRAGIPLIVQVQTVRGALDAAKAGADIIVAQGSEAGGHGSTRGTLALVPAVRDAIGARPLVAAGGVSDGRGIAASMILGADAVLCGTVFYATHESLAPQAAKALAVETGGDETVRSAVFDAARGIDWPDNWTLRARRNAFHDRWQASPRSIGDLERDVFSRGTAAGDPELLPVIVGEGVDHVHKIEPAADVFSRLVADTERQLTMALNCSPGPWQTARIKPRSN